MRKGVNKVALRLFEHNEKAYRAAVRMMDQYGKAAIVHPTGTGKSYIAFKLIEDNPEKVVIWLSPSEYIFKTQLESLKKNDPDFPLANVHFYTYAKLMCCTQAQLDEIAAQKPAYIILDEFHRAGAECWGESTVALLKLCPDAKLLGLTATNIRYLDNNRDMAEELFDSRVASNMTLGEAVVRGILPAPKYVTTVYQYQKALAKYQARVDNLRAPGIQDVNQKYLDALRRALEQADGLDRGFAHHMPIYLGDRTCYSAIHAALYDYPKEDDAMEIVVKQKRAAAYCRVSTGMECQESSYEIQKSYFTELLSNNPDEELVKVYADEGSGRSTQGRPEFRQMIQDCMDGKIDIIYTKSISRFSRNMLDCVTVVRRLKELGIPVIFEKEGINTMNGQSELFFHILAIIAEEESKSIGENVRAGIAYLHDQGIPTGRVTYGFRRVNKQGEWRIVESEARRVRYAFDQAAKGVCYADIRACLDKMEDEENTGVSWSQNRNRLPNMLKNVAYMGDYWTDCYYTAYSKNGHRYSKRNRGERAQVHLEDHHEGIVSREQFERVQTMIQMGLLHSGRKKYNDEQQKVLNDPKWQ